MGDVMQPRIRWNREHCPERRLIAENERKQRNGERERHQKPERQEQ
jgi:hypothetical protein